MDTFTSTFSARRGSDSERLENTLIQAYYLAFDLWEFGRRDDFVKAHETKIMGDLLMAWARSFSPGSNEGGLHPRHGRPRAGRNLSGRKAIAGRAAKISATAPKSP